jgi:hypothetical protein
MKKVLVLAGGLGSRLQTYTAGQYPKLLLSLGNSTMLDELIHSWFNINEVGEMLIVLSEEKYVNMIQKYLNVFHPDKPIKLCLYPKTDGTFRTIFYVLNKHKDYQKDIFMTWSDILPIGYPGRTPKEEPPNTITIFTDRNRVHRYLADGDSTKISYSPSHDGNIMGLYHYDKLDPFDMLEFFNIVSEQDSEVDFVDYLMHRGDDYNLIETSITDIGDVKKYEQYLNSQSVEQRWFNSIEFKNRLVTKTALNLQGQKVMRAEMEFYEKIHDTEAAESFPEILIYHHSETNSALTMRDLTADGYETVHNQVKNTTNLNTDHIELMIASYTDARIALNGKTKKTQFNNAIYNEYVQVPIERYNKIEYLLPKNITSVNGVKIGSFYEITNKLLAYLQSVEYDFGLIHGDTNSSNTMYNKAYNSIKFIDPRGIFGGQKYYGDVLYDQAKFMYGLSGYDNFNLDKNFKFEINDNEITFDTGGLELDELTSDRHISILVGLIWLKLPFYIKNNPNKVIASYFHGMALLSKYLK